MIEIFITEEFRKHYENLPKEVQVKTEKQEKLFRQNPFYPSLRTEKLEPKGKQLWSFRVDKSCRVFFRFISRDSVYFLTIDPHDWIYKLKF
ncbi:MAG: hypothetical protein COX37_01645 [Candidatus Nealsonbacteria bacterium CG23_combo_of_CG06-09_8_20_14_all_39_17]|uniref:Cytotoxin n=1 Tax=Candidatus Nealsonbacteria bacterium CG23_combo_of_CG06-09_8_20_14_all_39_17 TaxID=1974722 RepID=A0A2G9YUF5_9BACT|nr:MAG: hypothetical protein COX37_01645 [Candidatus Nealsonbacteria bacterium CG23_combo_of_CG06-09_8_20_14_all_39_17]